jgi:hypothetical protein
MLCLLLLPATSFSQQAACIFPQSNPLQDSPAVRDAWRKAYKDFKPGPRVQAELEKLKLREREARNAWSDSEYTLQDLNREYERIAIHRHLLLCIAIVAGDSDRVPELIVVQINTRENMKVFPSGKLPADPLQPNTVYETEPGGNRRVRYLSVFRGGSKGEKFAVFAREAEP